MRKAGVLHDGQTRGAGTKSVSGCYYFNEFISYTDRGHKYPFVTFCHIFPCGRCAASVQRPLPLLWRATQKIDRFDRPLIARPPVAFDGASGYDEAMIRALSFAITVLCLNHGLCAAAETNATGKAAGLPSQPLARQQLSEQWRAKCIAGRRSICGRILRIFPNGILVESGYTNLARAPLTKTWLIPGTVAASRGKNLVETREPGAMCVGMVFLTDLPRGKPRQYDYVVIAGYPTGEFTYTSVESVRKTVRRFSANLDRAVLTNLAAALPPHERDERR